MQRSLCLAVLLVAFLALAQSQSSTTASGYTSGGGGGSTASNTQIVQVVTFSFAHTDYTGLLKALVEKSYGLSLGIYTSAAGWTTGCTVTSVAAAARRAASVTFTASVTPAAATTARTNSQALTPTILSGHIDTVKAAESSDYSGVAAITVTGVAAPTITGGTTSGSSKVEVGMAAMVGSVLLAMSMRH